MTCHAFFSLVHTGAPFRELRFKSRRMWDYVSIRRHSELLSYARAIHWDFQKSRGQPRRSTDLLSVSAASFRHVLSVLSVPSSLHTLVLTSLRVEPAHQILILSIKTLRFLKLVESSFAPTSILMPRSSITTLWLEICSPPTTRHLLTLLGSSLKILRFRRQNWEAHEILPSTPLPLLTFFESPVIKTVPSWVYFASFQNIRVLILHSFAWDESSPSPIPSTALPHLTYLAAPPILGKALLLGRPVHTYRMYDPYYRDWSVMNHLERTLMHVAPYAQHVKELHLWLNVPPWVLVDHLALHFPNLVRVHLCWDVPNSRPGPWPKGGAHLSLREFNIGFYLRKEWSFPSDKCRNALRLLTKVCPALEVFRFGEVFFVDGSSGIDERDVRPDRLMDMRRTAEGEWKERKWGVVTPI